MLGNHSPSRAVGPPHPRIGLREALQSYRSCITHDSRTVPTKAGGDRIGCERRSLHTSNNGSVKSMNGPSAGAESRRVNDEITPVLWGHPGARGKQSAAAEWPAPMAIPPWRPNERAWTTGLHFSVLYVYKICTIDKEWMVMGVCFPCKSEPFISRRLNLGEAGKVFIDYIFSLSNVNLTSKVV